MSLYNGESVYPRLAQFFPTGGQVPPNVKEGALWYDDTTHQFKAIINGVVTALSSGLSGSLSTNQIAFGSAANVISGSANLTYTNSTSFLQVIGGTGGGSFLASPSIAEFRVPSGSVENIAFTNASAPAGAATVFQMGDDGSIGLFSSPDGTNFSAIDIFANRDIALAAGPTNTFTLSHSGGGSFSTGPVTIAGSNISVVVASGTAVMRTGAISATTSSAAVTVAGTGIQTTDSIEWAFNAAPGAGYTSGVFISAYVTSGNVNFVQTNPTAGSLTPAAATLNWQVIR